jgi:hypothetical protein
MDISRLLLKRTNGDLHCRYLPTGFGGHALNQRALRLSQLGEQRQDFVIGHHDVLAGLRGAHSITESAVVTVFTHDFAPKPAQPSVVLDMATGIFVLSVIVGAALALMALPGAR